MDSTTPLVLTLQELESVMGISLLPCIEEKPSEPFPPREGQLYTSDDNWSQKPYEIAVDRLKTSASTFVGSSATSSMVRSNVSRSSSSTGMEAITGIGTFGIGAGATITEAGSIMEFADMDELAEGRDSRTTFMIRRLPRYLDVDQLQILIESTGLLDDSYDLLYVPIFTGKAHANRGYAFINFKTPKLGGLFLSIIKYSSDSPISKQLSKCDIVYAHVQGRDDMVSNLTRVRDTSIDSFQMHRFKAPGNAFGGGVNLPPGLKLF
jgi:hypothetical protein